MKDISAIRKDYIKGSLSEEDVSSHPLHQFEKWWNEAIESELVEPNAMTLSTVSEHGFPSARIVLVKNFSEKGFVFYTNYESNKANDLVANNRVALLFFWKELERQVRIEGLVEKISEEESDAYFHSRPRGSQLAAWSSPQSGIISDRAALERNEAAYEEKFSGVDVPRPGHWGGYLVKPSSIEFWQGRSSRMHDRLKYIMKEDQWQIVRLAP